jgi:hypothetical protein
MPHQRNLPFYTAFPKETSEARPKVPLSAPSNNVSFCPEWQEKFSKRNFAEQKSRSFDFGIPLDLFGALT